MARVLPPLQNRVKVLVSGPLEQGDTTIVLNAGEGSKLPDPSTDGEYNLVLFDNSTYADPTDDPNAEDVHITGLASDTLTCDPLANDHDAVGVQLVMYMAWDKDAVDTVDDLLRDMIRSATSITYNTNGQASVITTPTREWTIAYRNDGEVSTITSNDTPVKVYTIHRDNNDFITSITYA